LATGIPARLTPAEGRKFGLTVGGAFLVITAILWWRGRHGAVPYVGGLGAILIAAGLLAPTRLGPVNRAWMGLAHLISKVTTPIFMGIVYFLIFTPIGVVMHLAGRRPMVHALQGTGYWFDRGADKPEASRMERQF
jgi:Saxitoxin biosynthesis operon protein SxtJ